MIENRKLRFDSGKKLLLKRKRLLGFFAKHVKKNSFRERKKGEDSVFSKVYFFALERYWIYLIARRIHRFVHSVSLSQDHISLRETLNDVKLVSSFLSAFGVAERLFFWAVSGFVPWMIPSGSKGRECLTGWYPKLFAEPLLVLKEASAEEVLEASRIMCDASSMRMVVCRADTEIARGMNLRANHHALARVYRRLWLSEFSQYDFKKNFPNLLAEASVHKERAFVMSHFTILKYSDALRTLARGDSIEPFYALVEEIAGFLFDSGHDRAAKVLLGYSNGIRPQTTNHSQLAALAERSGDLDSVAHHLEKAVSLTSWSPTRVQLLSHLGRLQVESKQFREAFSTYQQLLSSLVS